MKMCSSCSGECCICACADLCIAGHGDDHFCLASKEQVIDRLDRWEYINVDYMIAFLKRLGYEYDLRNLGSKKRNEAKNRKAKFRGFWRIYIRIE
jgi:hypothetical protein